MIIEGNPPAHLLNLNLHCTCAIVYALWRVMFSHQSLVSTQVLKVGV